MQGKLTVKDIAIGAIVFLVVGCIFLFTVVTASRKNLVIAFYSGAFLIALVLASIFGLGLKGVVESTIVAYLCFSLGISYQWIRENFRRDME